LQLKTGRIVVVASMLILVAVAGISAYSILGGGSASNRCLPLGGTNPTRSKLQAAQFGAVTEYALPQSSRWPNGITVGPDGSVWFGEESVPGVGRLFPNGTLAEYPWPTAGWTSSSGCGYRTGIWGVVYWNGMVWASDGDENALVGLNPQNGKTIVLNVTATAPEPYTLAVSPDGSLWFTSLGNQARLGTVSPGLNVTVYPVNGLKGEEPIQLDFVNSSYAYFVGLNPLERFGHLYSFDPQKVGPTVNPTQVGGTFQILEPSSVTNTGSLVWITQHLASSIASYDVESGLWTTYPTSILNFTYTTLPYFVEASGGLVWFNEHYANRIAVLNSSGGTLTEYSEADPPVENESLIQEDLTIGVGGGGAWFTSTVGNYIGFVEGTYRVPFDLTSASGNSFNERAGESFVLNLTLSGAWEKPLQVSVSDSENYSSVPKLIGLAPATKAIAAGAGPMALQVAVTLDRNIAPGRYTIAISVSDGLITQTSYCFLSVS
jgi:virginiamycin B lyase